MLVAPRWRTPSSACCSILVTRRGSGPVGPHASGRSIPLLLLAGLYGELDVLNGPGAMPVHDAAGAAVGAGALRRPGQREWWRSAPSRFWSTVLHAAYFSYYFIVLLPAFYFVWRRDLEALRHFVLVVMTIFVLCYLVFIFFPVAGPYYVFPRPTAWFTDNLSPGWCTPPSPAAAPTEPRSPARTSRRRSPPRSRPPAARAAWGCALSRPSCSRSAVVYCQMHYGVDALAGLWSG